ncbi:MAG: preprotein translocase subunit SecA [Sphaerochaetaceae bacterium]|nr:preprotein translocase subunit SecA [Sphaerochaetaceae bacterium]
MSSFLSKLFGSKSQKDEKKLLPIVASVNAQEQWAKSLSKDDFPKATQAFKEAFSKGESLDSMLPKAFALAREAAFRVLGERAYDVQVMGSIVLHQGNILEMKTGEGKTLTSVPAAYLNAIESKGVHIVTVNDYLAQRDSQWMGPVFQYLGLTVGCILSSMDNEARRKAYSADITYGTNNEFGFDYLRDNMKSRFSDKIQPSHHFCIIDEIDSILIDEARTPLIISGGSDDDTMLAINAQKIVSYFTECEKDPETGDYPVESPLARFDASAQVEIKGDYMVNEKSRHVTFTKQGMEHMEELLKRFGIISSSIYDDENFEYVHYVTQALTAQLLYKKDTDYIVKDGVVQIVDEFTGRILEGRRYSEGLHQAIEAKEHIKVLGRSTTLATITFQNFFRMYEKLSGMTGTAATEATEFMEIYGLDVVVVPTNLPVQRKDLTDLVYLNESFKYKAVIEEIRRVHATGQPILVGTTSIEKSEFVSSLLLKCGIKHNVLNAKNHAREAAIIEEAGRLGSVTISTNMAGRGTDIKLGGNLEAMARSRMAEDASEEAVKAKMEELRPAYLKEYEQVKALGGLYILGTERHESRRIDNQLRGRSGRQGDPGISRFMVSLDDPLMRIFAKDNIRVLLGRLGMNDGTPIENSMVAKTVENAQKQVEERNYEIRKHLLEYDNVLNDQRNFIYSQRDSILSDEALFDRILNAASEFVEDSLEDTQKLSPEARAKKALAELKETLSYEPSRALDAADLKADIEKDIEQTLRAKASALPPQVFNEYIRMIYLRQIDSRWQEHLNELEALRDAVSLRSYAQKNPLLEYKLEGSDIFDELLYSIKKAVVRSILLVKINVSASPVQRQARPIILGRPAAAPSSSHEALPGQQSVQVVRSNPKVGRNDPCPCGSGKKYKNCCGRNA